jgi:glycosyltransferase involved in cell wall biosynthesis
MKKKILFTSNVSWAMIKFRYDLLVHLINQGHTVYVVAPHDEFVKKLEKIGCICVNIHLNRKGVNPIADLKLIYDLYIIYTKIKPDIIFNYSIKPIIYGSIAARLANINSIAINIGLGYTFINTNIVTKISHLLYKFALQFPQMVWFINEDDKNEFIKRDFVTQKKTLVLPSEGVDTDYFKPQQKENSDFIFLLVARMLKDKGVVEFYEAAKIVKKQFPSVRFQLLGNVDLENPKGITQETLDKWDAEKTIEYLGYTKDIRNFVSNATCVVLPSYREGKGMTLIESGSMEKPLIATNVEGCKDIVMDNYNGFLCKSKDSQSLSEACIKMLHLDEKAIHQMGKNSRKFMLENFAVQKVINIYDLYIT